MKSIKLFFHRLKLQIIINVLEFAEFLLSRKFTTACIFVFLSGLLLLGGYNAALFKEGDRLERESKIKIVDCKTKLENIQESIVGWAVIYCKDVLNEEDLNECWIKKQKLNNQKEGKENENY